MKPMLRLVFQGQPPFTKLGTFSNAVLHTTNLRKTYELANNLNRNSLPSEHAIGFVVEQPDENLQYPPPTRIHPLKYP